MAEIIRAARDVGRAYYQGRDVGRAMAVLADALAAWDGRGNACEEEGKREARETSRKRSA